jgi:hypothetical protein
MPTVKFYKLWMEYVHIFFCWKNDLKQFPNFIISTLVLKFVSEWKFNFRWLRFKNKTMAEFQMIRKEFELKTAFFSPLTGKQKATIERTV